MFGILILVIFFIKLINQERKKLETTEKGPLDLVEETKEEHMESPKSGFNKPSSPLKENNSLLKENLSKVSEKKERSPSPTEPKLINSILIVIL